MNHELGLLDGAVADAIAAAAGEVVDGRFDDQFVVDIFQTGSGTSTNTNTNEVIANRATEILGGERGSRLVHPNDHVNMGQSSNDVIPTAIHLSALTQIHERLTPALGRLQAALEEKSREFWPIIKTGRTHLQDATPIRLGQEFQGYAGQVEGGIRRLHHAQEELSPVALGGTAVGTGVNTHPEFSGRVCSLLSEMAGVQVRETDNHFQAQSTLDGAVEASGVLRALAVSLHKVANDIRWLGSGPRAGLSELALPEVQPGSSIMPAKVNPVIAESLVQVAAQVIGNDVTVALAGKGGYFELNTMMPVAAYNLLQSIELLAASADNFAEQCVKGLQATDAGPASVEQGLMLGTALFPRHRLRRGRQNRQGSGRHGPDHPGGGQAEDQPHQRRAERAPRPGEDDRAGPGWRLRWRVTGLMPDHAIVSTGTYVYNRCRALRQAKGLKAGYSARCVQGGSP